MTIYPEAAFRSTAYQTSLEEQSVLPGRQLAEDLASGLRDLGHEVSGVTNDEPFWAVNIKLPKQSISLLVYLYYPNPDPGQAIWSVSIPFKLGLFSKLAGKQPDAAVVAVAQAVDMALQKCGKVYDIRWFKELPAEPFKASQYSAQPIAQV